MPAYTALMHMHGAVKTASLFSLKLANQLLSELRPENDFHNSKINKHNSKVTACNNGAIHYAN